MSRNSFLAAPTRESGCRISEPGIFSSLQRLVSQCNAISALSCLFLSAVVAHAQFGTQAVGTTSTAQTFTVTAKVAGTVKTVEILTAGASGLDFEAGTGSSTCPNTTMPANGTCTESVTFAPTAPGQRIGAVVLLDSGTKVLGTAYLNGVGTGGLGVLVPGNLITVAGVSRTWTSTRNGIAATSANLDQPASVTLDGAGNIYIADSLHNQIRKVNATSGVISAYAGIGNTGYTGDNGPAVNATFTAPGGVAIDGAGNLFVADTSNNVIRKIDGANGVISTVAGTGLGGFSGDGQQATAAQLNQPWGVTLDTAGNLYIADTANQRIRVVSASTGIITTIVGNGNPSGAGDGKGTYFGDGGTAIAAGLSLPHAVAFDLSGNMYIPDSANNRVRLVTAVAGVIAGSDTISTLAGSASVGYSGDGQAATSAVLNTPFGVAVDPAGNVFIADSQNTAIRKVAGPSSATPGIISTLLVNGTGVLLDPGTSNPLPISLYAPYSLYIDGSGDLFLPDYFNMLLLELKSNQAVFSLAQTPTRQGDKSATKTQVVENDGNAALDLTAITAGANAALDATATTCTIGNPFLAVGADCNIGAQFAPTVAGNPLRADIDVTGQTVNSPLDIILFGDATLVNSTTTAVTSSLNPSGFGQNVTFTATVTTGASSGDLTGTVSFFDGANPLATNVPLVAPATTATATFGTTALTVGVHSITATYNNANDATHFGSTSAPLSQTVLEATATSLTSSANPSTVGQSITLTATVTAPNGGAATPDGTVVFTDGATILGNVTISAAGVATFTTSALAQGLHAITASYGGDAAKQIQASVSAALNQDVQAASTTSISPAPNPSNYGVAVVFTVTVTPSASITPTGVVNILDGATQIGTATLVGTTGQVTFSTSSLIVGTHTITAAYQGDSDNSPSTSPAIQQVVNQTQTSTTLQAAPNPGIAGAPVTITATVAVVAGAASTTGTVTFTDNGAALGSATLTAAGTATITPTLAVGSHSIIATYGGDSNDHGSASAPLTLTVQLATTTTAILSATPNPALVLAAVTFTAKVAGNGGIPSGAVTFISDGASIGTANVDNTGIATFVYSNLAAGSHTITASYAGDTNDSPSVSAAITEVVGTIPTVTDLGASTTGGLNPQVILVSTVLGSSGPTPTGTVTYKNGATVIGSSTLDSTGVSTLTPNLALGTYSIIAYYGGDAQHSPSQSQPVSVSGTATGFNLDVTPATLTIKAGSSASITVNMSSNNGFTDTLGLGCGSLPAGVTCHFSNISVPLAANAAATAVLTIDTNSPLTGGAAAMNRPAKDRGVSLAGLLLPFAFLSGLIFWRFRRRHAKVWSTVLVIALSTAAMIASGCSGISSNKASPGTYTIQVIATGANSDIIHYENVSLTVN